MKTPHPVNDLATASLPTTDLPNQLRDIVQDAIEQHLPPEKYAVLKQVEASERRLIGGLVEMLMNGGGRA